VKVNKRIKCPACKGTGNGASTDVDCDECRGSGYIYIPVTITPSRMWVTW